MRFMGSLALIAAVWCLEGCGGAGGPTVKEPGRIYIHNMTNGVHPVHASCMLEDDTYLEVDVPAGEKRDLTEKVGPLPGGTEVTVHIRTMGSATRAGKLSQGGTCDRDVPVVVDGNVVIRIFGV